MRISREHMHEHKITKHFLRREAVRIIGKRTWCSKRGLTFKSSEVLWFEAVSRSKRYGRTKCELLVEEFSRVHFRVFWRKENGGDEVSNKDKKEEGKGRERWERWQEKQDRFSKNFGWKGLKSIYPKRIKILSWRNFRYKHFNSKNKALLFDNHFDNSYL